MSKLREMKSVQPAKEKGSPLFTIIGVFLVLGLLWLFYVAFQPPAPIDISRLEKGGQTKGPEGAKVSIVEFSDFECPACGVFYPVMEKIYSEYEGRVRFTYRHFPLPQHTHAQKAAEASECAAEQGKFWEMYGLLFQNQENLEIADLRNYAGQLGLDSIWFTQCLASGKSAAKVASDQSYGVSLGINATPTVYVNGQKLGNFTYESLKAAIDSRL